MQRPIIFSRFTIRTKTVVYFNIRVTKEAFNYGILAAEMGVSSGESYVAMESNESEKRPETNAPNETETVQFP
jgi:hypothetical protein